VGFYRRLVEGGFKAVLEPRLTLCVKALMGEFDGNHMIKLEDQVLLLNNGYWTVWTYPLDESFFSAANPIFTLRKNKVLSMKIEKTDMIMKYFGVTYKVAKQYEVILKDKQLRQIKAWYEIKKGDGAISAGSEAVLREILDKGKIFRKVLDKKR
jgi:hypothetical protein